MLEIESGTPSDGRAPTSHVVLIALAVALYAAVLPFSIMHLDLARDIAHGLAIARGERLPLEGPVLASSVHAGPLWYYLLAIPLAAWPAWLPVALFVGALAALKFPLAYLAGARLVDRRTGLIWALLLLFPGWMTFEAIVQNHASLVATCTLAILVAALGYLRTGRKRYLALAGLMMGTALHAHPSAAGIGLLLLAVLAWRGRRTGSSLLADIAILAAGAIIPFVPYLGSQAADGFPDLARAASFVGDPLAVGSLARLPALLAATFVRGGEVVASDLLLRVPAAGTWVAVSTMLLLVTGACGVVAALRRLPGRATLVAGLFALLVLAATVAVIRAATPFYMTYVVWTIGAGVLAAGLRACERLPVVRFVARGVLALAVVLAVATQASVADTLRRGAYPFAFFPLFDVKAPEQPALPMPFLVARAGAASGRLLCGEPAVAAHGSYAVHLFHTYALDAELRCGRARHIALGGTAGTPIAGVSRTITRGLGFVATDRLGPLVLLTVAQVVNPLEGARIPAPGTYPPIVPSFGATARHVFEFDAPKGEAVLVTDMYFAFTQPPVVSATANGSPIAPLASDRVSTAFRCWECAADAPVKWRLSVTTPALDRVDIVTVRSAEPSR